MYVSQLYIENFRSIETTRSHLKLGMLNVLVGANNAGKSSILKALQMIQGGHNYHPEIRVGSAAFSINLHLEDIPTGHNILNGNAGNSNNSGKLSIFCQVNGGTSHMRDLGNGSFFTNPCPDVEPHHFIVPFLSKRKTAKFNQDVREQYAKTIANDLEFLSAKLSRIGTPGYPTHEIYKKTCIDVLGFLVSAIPSETGLRPGVYLDAGGTLPIEQMGEGVPHIVAFLISLADSKGKLFIIEELENDLHPKALKAILDLILESSKYNQFVISTHSNIVVRHLASIEGSKLYNIKTVAGTLPTKAEIELVAPCSGLMYPDTDLGENARHGEVFDEQAETYVFPGVQTAGSMPGAGSRI